MLRKPLERGQREERDGDEGEAEDEADLVALRVEQGADGERGDDEAEGLGEGDCAVLRGGEMEAVGEVGENGAEHGGDHSVDEDGENGGEDQHAGWFLSRERARARRQMRIAAERVRIVLCGSGDWRTRGVVGFLKPVVRRSNVVVY